MLALAGSWSAISGASLPIPGGHGWKVDWIATDPETRRLSYTGRRTTAEEYVARIEALRALGEGYSEVSLADRAYPYVCLSFCLSFRGGYGEFLRHGSAEDLAHWQEM
jgi:hypothetical protein